MPSELVRKHNADVLRGNTFAILGDDAPESERAMRLLALVPMALQVVDEARDTIKRLNEENESLKEELRKLRET